MGLKLEAGKTYIDADGRKVRIIYTGMPVEGAPCAGLVDCDGHVALNSYGKDGVGITDCDLVYEYDPLEDLPVDTPAWVRDDPDKKWKLRLRLRLRIRNAPRVGHERRKREYESPTAQCVDRPAYGAATVPV